MTPRQIWSLARFSSIEAFLAGEEPQGESYLYCGAVAECKKGRGSQQGVTQAQQNIASAETPTYLAGEQPLLSGYDQYTPSSPSTFSPAVQSQYDSDVANLRNTYGNLAQSGFRTLAARGLGAAPTGATSSVLNTANKNMGDEEAQAFRNAQVNNTNQGFRALAGKQSVLNQYNPETPLSGASTSALRQSQMGSTLGDIGSGIAAAAGSTGQLLTGIGNL